MDPTTPLMLPALAVPTRTAPFNRTTLLQVPSLVSLATTTVPGGVTPTIMGPLLVQGYPGTPRAASARHAIWIPALLDHSGTFAMRVGPWMRLASTAQRHPYSLPWVPLRRTIRTIASSSVTRDGSSFPVRGSAAPITRILWLGVDRVPVRPVSVLVPRTSMGLIAYHSVFIHEFNKPGSRKKSINSKFLKSLFPQTHSVP